MFCYALENNGNRYINIKGEQFFFISNVYKGYQ